METMRRQQSVMREWIGHDLVDHDGSKVGPIDDVYVDDDTGRPEWVTVKTGLFGRKVSFVPLQGLEADGDHLVSTWEKSTIKDAPRCEPDGHLEPDEENDLYQHYGMGGGRDRRATERREGAGGPSGTKTADRDAMTRSEEELRIDREQRPVGKARLRKWIETEHQTVTVPVRKERAEVVREPITHANRDRAMSGPDLTESDHEMVLDEEQVQVEKKVVPKERVRLDKDVEVEDRRVEGDLRTEQIDVEGAGDRRRSQR